MRARGRFHNVTATAHLTARLQVSQWGRNLETYSESPELVSALASSMIDGAQWGDRLSPYMQVIAVAKHAAAYQVEDGRFARNAVVSAYDLSETYFPVRLQK